MPGPPPNVLIIDDDALHLNLYKWMLEKQGYRALKALVGSTSVPLPKEEHIDLVLMDYRLNSTLTARDVAKAVKEAFPGAPVVVLSELAWPPDDIRGFATGFVSKGEPEQLMATIAELLGARRS